MAVIILIYNLELTYDDYQLWAELLSSPLIYPFTRKIVLVVLFNECYKIQAGDENREEYQSWDY